MASSTSPAWLAVAAGMSLAAILGVVGLSTVKVLASDGSTSVREKPSEVLSAPTQKSKQAPPRSNAVEWISKLSDSRCDGPCIGGSGCQTTGNKPCPSRYTCILGYKNETLDPELPLNLHLSAIFAGVNLCQTDTVACFTPASTKVETCASLSNACAHAGRSTIPVPLLARDLITGGTEVRVVRDGNLLATGTIRYGDSIGKAGLCSGFKAGLVSTASVNLKFVTFFVEPRGANN